MQRQAVVVRTDERRQRRVEVHPRVLQGLGQAKGHAAEERRQGHDQVGAGHAPFHGEIQGLVRHAGGRHVERHGRASTMTFPHMVWCAIPQYS